MFILIYFDTRICFYLYISGKMCECDCTISTNKFMELNAQWFETNHNTNNTKYIAVVRKIWPWLTKPQNDTNNDFHFCNFA